ncbi:MAG TPA: dienelactone hydrolase family protein [Rhizomicrobium sp.]|jgi:carboxymethylenebutenolidase|nr:dienelactone hydrolase family protein [Rhizomicrobium sp.]
MIERFADIGGMNTFICHPERGGPHPVILFYMDAPGIREELRGMARRLASAGYYVMLPSPVLLIVAMGHCHSIRRQYATYRE